MSENERLEKWLEIQNKFESIAKNDKRTAMIFSKQIETIKIGIGDILQYILFFEEK